MKLGQRVKRLFTGGEEGEGNPEALVDLQFVPLAQGPMYVSELEREGLKVVGLASFDVIVGSETAYRIMVRRADLPVARAALRRLMEGPGLGWGEEVPDEVMMAADEAARRAVCDLFVAADRLMHTPSNRDLVGEIDRLRSFVSETPAPFGLEPTTWDRIAASSAAVVDAAATAGDGRVEEEARSLRTFLREYV